MLEQKARLETASKLETQALERQLLTLKESLADAERKASLGSQQEQGEVQELVLEDVLQKAFPKDFVEEVGKGFEARTVNCAFLIRTILRQNARFCLSPNERRISKSLGGQV